MENTDNTNAIKEAVQQALDAKTPVVITGGGSKDFLGKSDAATTISTLQHTGIVNYEPTELVVTARSGTPLQELVDELKANGQRLPFEPPMHPGATLGGVLACGLSGPARPFAGSARDYVLGVRLINGQAQHLRFGGDVMKNVAGYDVSRLQIGAYGTLGLLLDASMKVLPIPEAEITLVSTRQAHDFSYIRRLGRLPVPVTAAALLGDRQYIRLSGTELAVQSAAQQLEGDIDPEAEQIWAALRDQTHPFFKSEQTLWRISVAEYTDHLEHLDGEWMFDWAGAQRWLKSSEPAERVFAAAADAGGHATRYGIDNSLPRFQPLSGVMARLQKRLRDSFDADRLFNPGHFHPELDASMEMS